MTDFTDTQDDDGGCEPALPPLLEVDCDACGSGGGWLRGGELVTCPACHGRKLVPTAYGREVLEFLRRHLLARP